MASSFQQILSLLDRLTSAEQAAIIAELAQRIQGVVGDSVNEDADSVDPVTRRYLRYPRVSLGFWSLVVNSSRFSGSDHDAGSSARAMGADSCEVSFGDISYPQAPINT